MPWRRATIGFALAIGLAGPAGAGGPDPSVDLTPNPSVLSRQPPPEPAPGPCLPALPCGTRLYGASQKNGIVGVIVPVLHW